MERDTQPVPVNRAPAWRQTLASGSTFARAVGAELIRRWPKILFLLFLWGLAKVCDYAEEPLQSACELVLKLARLVTP